MADLKTTNTSYPASLDTATAISDISDNVVAIHQNAPNTAIVAIETELGVSPKGTTADVATRLSINSGTDGGVRKGTAFPVTPPATPHFFYRTDTSLTYIYNVNTAQYDLVATPSSLTGHVMNNMTTTFTVVDTFAPTSTNPPFLLGANALGQKVTGFNADQIDGFHATTAGGASVAVATDTQGAITVNISTVSTPAIIVNASNTTTGSAIKLNHVGTTNPGKVLRSYNGAFDIVSDDSTTVLASFSETGKMLLDSRTNADTAELKSQHTNGPNLILDNSGTKKYIRNRAGVLEFVNNAGSTVIMSLSDTGTLSTIGGFSTTGSITGSVTGSATSLKSYNNTGANTIYIGNDTTGARLKIDSTDYGTTWPISITGSAGTSSVPAKAMALGVTRTGTWSTQTMAAYCIIDGDISVSPSSSVSIAGMAAEEIVTYTAWNNVYPVTLSKYSAADKICAYLQTTIGGGNQVLVIENGYTTTSVAVHYSLCRWLFA